MTDDQRRTERVNINLDFSTGPHGITLAPSLKPLHEKIQEDIVPVHEGTQPPPGTGQVVLLTFFTLAHSLIELRSIEILYYKLAEERHQTNKTEEFFRKHLNQHQREDLLFRCGLVKGHTYTNMKTARRARNKIVHSPQNNMWPDFKEGLETTANKTLEATLELEEMYVDIHMPDELK